MMVDDACVEYFLSLSMTMNLTVSFFLVIRLFINRALIDSFARNQRVKASGHDSFVLVR